MVRTGASLKRSILLSAVRRLPDFTTCKIDFSVAICNCSPDSADKEATEIYCLASLSATTGSRPRHFKFPNCKCRLLRKSSLELSTSYIRRHLYSLFIGISCLSICELLVRSAFRRSMMKFINSQHYGYFAQDSGALHPNLSFSISRGKGLQL